MKKLAITLTTAAAALTFAAPSQAAVTISAVNGSDPYSGPPVTYDFEGALPTGGAPITGGAVVSGTVSGQHAQPFGSTGNYWSIGPTDGSPGTLNLSSFGGISTISFIWGSVDSGLWNLLEVLDGGGNVIQSWTGDAVAPANGDQTLPANNPLVTLTFSGGDEWNVGGLRFSANQNAFEVDNFSVQAVPEPSTWAFLLVGFAAVGYSLRSRKAAHVKFA